jgi:hypothetical protein
MTGQPPESTSPPPAPENVPPPPPGPEASRAEWHAWRRQQRDYARSQGGWYGPGWSWFGWGWFWGAVLVLLGIYFLLNNLGLLGWLRGDILWPVFLILFGVLLIVGRGRWWR